MTRHLVMVGQMASGKTAVGRLVADGLQRPFRDSDAFVAARTGMTAADILDSRGVEELHALERTHLAAALASSRPSVIAAAAATIDRASMRSQLRNHEVVWLRVPVATLAKRAAGDPARPMQGDPHRYLAELDRRRRGILGGVATAVIDAEGMRPERLAAVVLARLRPHRFGAMV